MTVRILRGDCRAVLREIPAESIHCCVTSPPYWGLRDYGCDGQIGLEQSPEAYVAELVAVFREVRRVLRDDGTLWLNLGDSYCSTDKWGGGRSGNSGKHTVADDGSVPSWAKRLRQAPIEGVKPKDLIGIPWRVAFALQADGWRLRQDIVWHKPNPMPESVTDRCTKAHEYLFLLAKSERYFFDQDAILEPASPITHARLSQDTLAQRGSDRGGARGNGNMKAVGRGLVPGNRTHRGADAAADGELGHRTKAGLVDHAKRSRAALAEGVKNNGSFNAAMAEMPIERNKRSVWTITTQPFKEAHFATFPPKLVEPCIMAGTSARGVCPSCGCPWRRVTGRERVMDGDVAVVGEWAADDAGRLGASGVGHWRFSTTRKTLGWYPDCACAGLPALPRLPRRPIQRQDEPDGDYDQREQAWREACEPIQLEREKLIPAAEGLPTVPATVLDPFGGAGTVGLVAARLARDALLVELNPDYAELAGRRITQDAPLLHRVEAG